MATLRPCRWDAIFLNEAFAEFVTYLGTDFVEPDFRIWDSFYNEEMYSVMQYDGTTSSHPTIQEVPTSNDADFGSITYSRGSAVNRFLMATLSFDTMRDGLQDYLEAHQVRGTFSF